MRSISSSPSLQNLAQRLQSFPNNPVTIHQLRKSFLLAVGEGKGEGGGCMVSFLCSFVRSCNFSTWAILRTSVVDPNTLNLDPDPEK